MSTTDESLAQYVARVVDAAPPLTPEQSRTLGALMSTSTP